MKSQTVKVYMFPGLGAEYPGMLESFCRHYPWADAAVAQWEAIIGVRLADDPSYYNLREREYRRQLRIHCLNLLWWRLQGPGATGRIVCCGHSLGFYAALVAAGALSEKDSWFWLKTVFEEAWREFSANTQRIEVLTTTVAIDAHRLAKQFNVEVIARNSGQQIVIYGLPDNIALMRRSLAWASLRHTDLGTVIPFHSIVMHRVCDRLFEVGRAACDTFKSPHYEVWSHLSGDCLEQPESLYRTLLEQPMRPVNWQMLIRNLAMRYQPEFIEIGPNRILGQLVRWSAPHAKISHSDHIRKAHQSNTGVAA